MESLESIIQQGKTGRIDRVEAELVCAAEGIQLTDMYNQVAVSVAKHFQAGTISYEDGDSVMNAIFSMMTDDATNGHPGPYVEPAWSIYLAFDEGEYDHGDGTDPI